MSKIQKHSKVVPVQKVGYSDARLQPAYLITTSLFFLAWPIFGAFSAFLIVSVPAFMVATKVAQLERLDPVADAAAWQQIADIYAVIAERDRLAEIESKKPVALNEKNQTRKSSKHAYSLRRSLAAY